MTWSSAFGLPTLVGGFTNRTTPSPLPESLVFIVHPLTVFTHVYAKGAVVYLFAYIC